MITLQPKQSDDRRRGLLSTFHSNNESDLLSGAFSVHQSGTFGMSPFEQSQNLTMADKSSQIIQMAQNPVVTDGLCPRCRDKIKKGEPLNCPDCEKKLQSNMSTPGMTPPLNVKDGNSIQLNRDERSGTTEAQQNSGSTKKCDGTNYNPNSQCCTAEGIKEKNPIDKLEECPDRVPNKTKMNEYDGCSVPWWLTIGKDKDNPAGGFDTQFSDKSIHGKQPQSFQPKLPCDIHDKSYQTCWPSHLWEKKWKQIDQQLFSDSMTVCRNSNASYYRKAKCYEAVNKARILLPLGSKSAFIERQKEYCNCCPNEKKPSTGKKEFSTTSANVWMFTDPNQWDNSDHLIKKLPINSTVTLLDEASDASFNQTSDQYRWWNIRHGGQNGWVMKSYLKEA